MALARMNMQQRVETVTPPPPPSSLTDFDLADDDRRDGQGPRWLPQLVLVNGNKSAIMPLLGDGLP